MIMAESERDEQRQLEDHDENDEELLYFVWRESCQKDSQSFGCHSYLRPNEDDDAYLDDRFGDDDFTQQLTSSTDHWSSSCHMMNGDDEDLVSCFVMSNKWGYYQATCSLSLLLSLDSLSAACTCHNATIYRRSDLAICQDYTTNCAGDNGDEDCPSCEYTEQCSACRFGSEVGEWNGLPIDALTLQALYDDDSVGSVEMTSYVDNSQSSIANQHIAWNMDFSRCKSDLHKERTREDTAIVLTVVISALLGLCYLLWEKRSRKTSPALSTPLSSGGDGVLT